MEDSGPPDCALDAIGQVRRPSERDLLALRSEIGRIADQVGLAGWGVTSADPLHFDFLHLQARKAMGLADSMQFTYRRPYRSTNPKVTFRGAKSIIVGALSYSEQAPIDPSQQSSPTAEVASYAARDHYEVLRCKLEVVSTLLKSKGYWSRVVIDDNALMDKPLARRAGVGWIGKNTLLLLPKIGSYVVIGSVVTDCALPPTPIKEMGGCGSCTRCMSSCPTTAILEPGVLDSSRCLAWLLQREGVFPKEFRAVVGRRIYGCDDCQSSCPIGRRGREASLPLEPEIHDILTCLALGDQELLGRFAAMYIPKRDPNHLRRNLLIALGNSGRVDSSVREVLTRYLRSDVANLRLHAAWASEALGVKDHLEAEMVAEVSQS